MTEVRNGWATPNVIGWRLAAGQRLVQPADDPVVERVGDGQRHCDRADHDQDAASKLVQVLDVERRDPRAATLFELAQKTIGWRPVLDLDTALEWTADWYVAHREGADMAEACRAQSAEFVTRSEAES